MLRLHRLCYFFIAALALLTLSACSIPSVILSLTPNNFAITAGDSIVFFVETSAPYCPQGAVCDDIDGIHYDYEIFDLPEGVSYSIDTSLQSDATPGVVRITLTVAANTRPGFHTSLVQAFVFDRQIGYTELRFSVLPSQYSAPTTAISAIAAAGDSSYALLSDNNAHAWGRNDYGQLGNGENSNHKPVPTLIDSNKHLSLLKGSPDPLLAHTIALSADGSVQTWGHNSAGQLGHGNRLNLSTPKTITDISNAIAVSAGSEFSFAVLADGTVWGWGDNAFGQLGGNHAQNELRPVQIAELSNISTLSSGGFHTLAINQNGQVFAWGGNGEDQLGRSDTSSDLRQIATLSNIIAVATGWSHSLALSSDGTVWSWGNNQLGQLGDNSQNSRSNPSIVAGVDNIIAIAAGANYSLALSSDGSVWSWGSNSAGQLGVDDIDDDRIELLPVQIPNINNARAIAAGASHTMVLLDCNRVLAWGSGDQGQIGNGQTIGFFSYEPNVVLGFEGSGCDPALLRITKLGSGLGTIGSAPDFVSCTADTWPCLFSQFYPLGEIRDLSATATPPSAFAGWGLDCSGSDSDISVLMDSDKYCSVNLTADQIEPYLLTVHTSGGDVSSDPSAILGPEQIDCGDTCSAIFAVDTQVILSASADPGYQFIDWSRDCSGNTANTQVLIDQRKTCEANFSAYQLDISINGEGSVNSTPSGIDCGETCSSQPGIDSVTLRATAAFGWQFDRWGDDCSDTADQLLVAMDADKNCSANFVRIPDMSILTFTIQGPGSVISAPAGIDCGTTCQALFATDSTVQLTAIATEGNTLLNWFGDCPSQASGNSTSIVMDSEKQCHAVFVDINQPDFPVAEFTYAISSRQVGQLITFDGSTSFVYDPDSMLRDPFAIVGFSWDFNDDNVFDATGGRTTTAITQYAFQSAGRHPVRLQVRGGSNGPNNTPGTSSETQDVLIVDAQSGLFNLSVGKTGNGDGHILSQPPGAIGCNANCNNAGPIALLSGSEITLLAIPEVGSQFNGWSGTGCTANSATIQVDMLGARSCTANFSMTPLTVDIINNGNGHVSSNPLGIDCGSDCTQVYPPGTVITLTATPDPGFVLANWLGCINVSGNQCTITLTLSTTIEANFEVEQFDLTVSNSGNGTISATGIMCGSDCSETYPVDTIVDLVATADPGWQFNGWGQDCSGSNANTQLTMDSAKTCSANFIQLGTNFTLTVNVSGTGIVFAQQPIESISCLPVCSATYPSGTNIVLSGQPTVSATMTTWSGCDQIIDGACTLTMNSDRTISADFQ